MRRLREFIAYFIIKRKAKAASMKNFGKKSSSGRFLILFSVQDDNDYSEFMKMMAYINDLNLPADAVVYTNEHLYKKFSTRYFQHTIFTGKGINFLHFPNVKFTHTLATQVYDKVITTCRENCIPLDYIAAMAHAEVKFSEKWENTAPFYNFLLDCIQGKGKLDMLKTAFGYLNKINSVAHA